MRRTCDWWEHDGPDRTVCAEEGRYVIQPGGDHRPGLVFCGKHLNQLGGSVLAVQLVASSGPVCDWCSGSPAPWVLRTRDITFTDMLVEYDDGHTATHLSDLGDRWATCEGCKPFVEAILQGTDDALDLFLAHVREVNPAVIGSSDPDELESVLREMWETVFATAVWPLTREAAT